MALSNSVSSSLPQVSHITDAHEFFHIEALYSDMAPVAPAWEKLRVEMIEYESNQTQQKQTHLHIQLRSFFESIKHACHMHRIRRGNDHEALATFGIKFSQAIKRIYDRFTETENISSQQYLTQLLRESFPGLTFKDPDFARKMRDEFIEKGKTRDTLRGIPASRPILATDLSQAGTPGSDSDTTDVLNETHDEYTVALSGLQMAIPSGIEAAQDTQSQVVEESGEKLRMVMDKPVDEPLPSASTSISIPYRRGKLTSSPVVINGEVTNAINLALGRFSTPTISNPSMTVGNLTKKEVRYEIKDGSYIPSSPGPSPLTVSKVNLEYLEHPVDYRVPVKTEKKDQQEDKDQPTVRPQTSILERKRREVIATVGLATMLIISGILSRNNGIGARMIEFASARTNTASTPMSEMNNEKITPSAAQQTPPAEPEMTSNLVGVNAQSKKFIRFRNTFKNRGQTDLSDGMDRFAANAIAEYKENDTEFQKRFNAYVAFLKASQVAPKPGHRGLAQVNKDYFANRLKTAEKFQKDVSSGKIADEDTLKKHMPESDDRNLFDAIDSTVAKSAPASIQDYNLELKGNEGYNNIVRDAAAHSNQPLYRFYQEVLEEMKSTSLPTDNPADAADKFFQIAREKLGGIDEAGRAKYPMGSDVRGGLTYCIDTHERGIKRGDNNLVMKALTKFKPNPKKK